MIQNVLEELGLAKNEAKIYETLLREGESGVSIISTKAEINRRNVYDSLNRLIEKGLIYEIRSSKENSYRAVDPHKLHEIISEKKILLDSVFAEMESLYDEKPHDEEIYIYRGVEGWKNHLRNILRVGEDTYTIGGTGAWVDEKISVFMSQFLKDAQAKGIKFHSLVNGNAKTHDWAKILPGLDPRFLPEEYTTNVAIDIFGDHVVIIPDVSVGKFDENSTLTVMVNKNIADAFRIWFSFMWNKVERTH